MPGSVDLREHPRVREFALERPPKFYKYIGLDGDRKKWARNMIVESEVFFARPSMFNDPLDCKIPPSFEADREEIKAFWEGRWAARGENLQAREEDLEGFIRRAQTDEGRFTLAKVYLDLLDTYGITCFVGRADNFLMWSYYAASHSGIVVRFDTGDQFIGQLPRPLLPFRVDYAADFPRVSAYDRDRLRVAIGTFGTKAEAWAHEEEWRFVRVGSSGPVTMPPGMIDGVVLGLRTSPEHTAVVRGWIAEAGRPIELLKIIHQPNSFRLDVVPFDS
jgi:hypothetical protein